MRSRSIPGVAPTTRTFSIFPSVTRTREFTELRQIIAVCRRLWHWRTPRSWQTRKQFSKTLRAHRNGSEIKPALVALYRQQSASCIRRAANSGIERRRRRSECHGGSVSRTFPISGGAARIDSVWNSILRSRAGYDFSSKPTSKMSLLS